MEGRAWHDSSRINWRSILLYFVHLPVRLHHFQLLHLSAESIPLFHRCPENPTLTFFILCRHRQLWLSTTFRHLSRRFQRRYSHRWVSHSYRRVSLASLNQFEQPQLEEFVTRWLNVPELPCFEDFHLICCHLCQSQCPELLWKLSLNLLQSKMELEHP